MFVRLGLCLILMSMLGACSTVPERYAPWRGNEPESGGHQPNLGEVPAAPNVDSAKEEIEQMRIRMEADRQNAYLASQGLVPQGTAAPVLAAPNDLAPPPLPSSSDLMPLTTPPVMSPAAAPASSAPAQAPSSTIETSPISSTNLPDALPQLSPQQAPQAVAGNVYYNYDPNSGTNYTYGNNARVVADNVDINLPAETTMASNDMTSGDQSVAIDLSVLGDSSSPVRKNGGKSMGGISAGDPIAYFAHGSAKLGAKDRAAIRNLASQLKQRPQPVMLAGNASRRTGVRNSALSREINLKMSERRAKAVMEELINQGVSAEKIYLSAYGDSIPNRREDDGHNEAANRRVEVLFDR